MSFELKPASSRLDTEDEVIFLNIVSVAVAPLSAEELVNPASETACVAAVVI